MSPRTKIRILVCAVIVMAAVIVWLITRLRKKSRRIEALQTARGRLALKYIEVSNQVEKLEARLKARSNFSENSATEQLRAANEQIRKLERRCRLKDELLKGAKLCGGSDDEGA